MTVPPRGSRSAPRPPARRALAIRTPRRTLALLALLALGCGAPAPGARDAGPIAPGIDAGPRDAAPASDALVPDAPAPDAHLAWAPGDHPIDLALYPRLLREGATDIVIADPATLCRRFALELLGRLPTRDERASLCADRDPESMARAMMDQPAFVERERRIWIARVGATPLDMLATHLADADRIYDALARGELGYDDFVARLVAHPVLAVQRPAVPETLDDPRPTVTTIFRLFLGRPPSGRELPDFAGLLRPWRRTSEPRCEDGYGTWRRPAILDPAGCDDPVLGDAACTSVELGARVTVAIPRGAAPTGLALACPPATTRDDVYYYERFHGGAPPDAIEIELERPGRLLATRAELWDRAAELALSRLLGWWSSSADEPRTVVPEVRRVTAEWFRARPGHDLRDLYAFVLGSVLATASAELPLPADRSPWASGPTRWLDATQYLGSLEAFLGVELGECDPHTDEPAGTIGAEFPDRLRAPVPAGLEVDPDAYRAWGRALGGCRGPVPPPSRAALDAVFAQASIASRACALAGARVAPEGFDRDDRSEANVDRLALDLFDRALLRAPTAGELAAIHDAARACAAAPDCTMDELVHETCTAIARSSAFAHE